MSFQSSILPLDTATSKAKDQKSTSDTKVNFPNSLTDLDSLEKVNKFKSDLENYEKLLMIKMALNSSEKTGSGQDNKLLSPPVSERGRQTTLQVVI